MAYLAVAYPKLAKADFDWIQQYRAVNDAKFYSVVQPHFSIVFPVSDMQEDAFVREIGLQAQELAPIEFELKVATINHDGFEDFYHEFLVPEKGYAAITKMHDKLYSAALSKYLRLDLDYIPHIGIGNSEKPEISKKRMDDLNSKDISIFGTIDSLDIIEYKEGDVATIEKLSFHI